MEKRLGTVPPEQARQNFRAPHAAIADEWSMSSIVCGRALLWRGWSINSWDNGHKGRKGSLDPAIQDRGCPNRLQRPEEP